MFSLFFFFFSYLLLTFTGIHIYDNHPLPPSPHWPCVHQNTHTGCHITITLLPTTLDTTTSPHLPQQLLRNLCYQRTAHNNHMAAMSQAHSPTTLDTTTPHLNACNVLHNNSDNRNPKKGPNDSLHCHWGLWNPLASREGWSRAFGSQQQQ